MRNDAERSYSCIKGNICRVYLIAGWFDGLTMHMAGWHVAMRSLKCWKDYQMMCNSLLMLVKMICAGFTARILRFEQTQKDCNFLDLWESR